MAATGGTASGDCLVDKIYLPKIIISLYPVITKVFITFPLTSEKMSRALIQLNILISRKCDIFVLR